MNKRNGKAADVATLVVGLAVAALVAWWSPGFLLGFFTGALFYKLGCEAEEGEEALREDELQDSEPEEEEAEKPAGGEPEGGASQAEAGEAK